MVPVGSDEYQCFPLVEPPHILLWHCQISEAAVEEQRNLRNVRPCLSRLIADADHVRSLPPEGQHPGAKASEGNTAGGGVEVAG